MTIIAGSSTVRGRSSRLHTFNASLGSRRRRHPQHRLDQGDQRFRSTRSRVSRRRPVRPAHRRRHVRGRSDRVQRASIRAARSGSAATSTLSTSSTTSPHHGPGLVVGRDLNRFNVGGNLTFQQRRQLDRRPRPRTDRQPAKGTGTGQGSSSNGNFTVTGADRRVIDQPASRGTFDRPGSSFVNRQPDRRFRHGTSPVGAVSINGSVNRSSGQRSPARS